ncbi:hypothetical protein KQI65_09740 [bacterium]|nr:hypothetical protein [bacterium]
MRKINAIRLAIVSGVAVLMLGFMIVPNITQAEGAIVITEAGCNLGAPGATWVSTHSVATPSGNTKLTCHFTIAEAYIPSQAVIEKGWTCNTYLGLTNESMRVIDTEGNAMIRCTIKANSN